jgi:uncharacterized membrane protein
MLRLTLSMAIHAALASAAAAQTIPDLFRVPGDAVSIHAENTETSEVVGTLPAGASGVEVISHGGDWGEVNAGEVTGWVALKDLENEGAAPWHQLQGSLRCLGTEPFWDATLSPDTSTMLLKGLDAPGMMLNIAQSVSPMDVVLPSLGIAFGAPGETGFAVLRPENCSDGMSERIYGLSAVFFVGKPGAMTGLSGCCTMAAD